MAVFAVIGVIVIIMFIAAHIFAIGFEILDIIRRVALSSLLISA